MPEPCLLQAESSAGIGTTEFVHWTSMPFRGVGWYTNGRAFILVDLHDPAKDTVRVNVWNGKDPRPELRRLLDLPEFSNEFGGE